MHDNEFNETLTPTHLMLGFWVQKLQKLNHSSPKEKQFDVNSLSKRMKYLHIHYNWERKQQCNKIRGHRFSL